MPTRQPHASHTAFGRQLQCQAYNLCLTDALAAGWPSWSCDPQCRAFAELAPVEKMRDLIGLLVLCEIPPFTAQEHADALAHERQWQP